MKRRRAAGVDKVQQNRLAGVGSREASLAFNRPMMRDRGAEQEDLIIQKTAG